MTTSRPGLHACLPTSARLAPELATAALAYGDGDGGARTLARRRAAFVRIHGAGRTGACLASFLAASGVGHVVCADPAPAEHADLAPAGLIEADLGAPRQEGAARAVGRAAPWCRTGDDGTVPDLVVLTRPALPDLADGLVRDRVPHLAVAAGEAIGVIGPLVRPGRSACLRCVDLRKTDADPDWPKIVAQATFARVRPQACDTVLAAMAAALACAQALALIDRPWRRAGFFWPGHGERDAGGGAAGLAVAAPDLAAAPCVPVRRGAYRDGSSGSRLRRNDAVTDAS